MNLLAWYPPSILHNLAEMPNIASFIKANILNGEGVLFRTFNRHNSQCTVVGTSAGLFCLQFILNLHLFLHMQRFSLGPECKCHMYQRKPNQNYDASILLIVTNVCAPHRAMKMEKKTVAGLSNKWLAWAVPHAVTSFQ